MNKTDLITTVADSAHISKTAAQKAIGSFLQAVTEALAGGDRVTISGFGSFSVVERSSRTGRNPQNGQKIEIPACNVVRFKSGKHLIDTIR